MLDKKQKSIALLALWVALVSVPVLAADSAPIDLIPSAQQKPAEATTGAIPNVVVRVGEHESFDRVVFDWPRLTTYKVTRDGAQATIQFSAAGAIQLKPATHLTRGRDFISGIDSDGHLKVSFELDPKSTLKDFFNGNSIALDIVGPSLKQALASAAIVEKPKAEPPKPIASAAPLPAAPVIADVAPPQTTYQKNDKGDEVVASASQATTPIPVPVVISTSSIAAVPAGTAVQSPPVVEPDKTTEKSQQPASASAAAREIPSINVGTRPVQVASLDPHVPLRAAVWSRAGYGYIIFDKKITMTLDGMTAGLTAPLVKLQPLDFDKATGFRFAIPDKVEAHVSREGTAWSLYLTKLQPDVPVTTTLVAQPDFALGARFLLPLPDAPEPLRFFDTTVGDELIVVPLSQPDTFGVKRDMADFHILSASQGLVLKPLTDKLVVRSVSDGIEITSEIGLRMSPTAETGYSQQSSQKNKAAIAGKSLFDFSLWSGNKNQTFTRARQGYQQAIVDVPERERNRARLEFARFYFAHGYGAEALALLNYLAQQVPDLATHSDFLTLSGASKILSNKPDSGLKDLEDANLADVPEIKLWQAVAHAEVGDWVDAEEKFAASESLLAGYPEPFYSRFFVLAVESALAVGNDHEAADWLNQLQSVSSSDRVLPAINYLHGVLHAKAGRAQAAAAAWKIAAASNDRLYKVRSEMALIDLGVANLSLTPAQAADRLEALRFAWRGDDLEVDILHRLGLFYIKAKNIKAGLTSLSQAIQLYPHSPVTPKIHQEMVDAFRDVFVGDIEKKISPLDALSIYQEYHDTLMPNGVDGVNITRALAERLASVDLIDQSCDLLIDMAKNSLKGADKGRVVVRVAALKMVDHKAQDALDALDLSSGDFLPAGIQQERLLLRAKALLELHRNDEALAEIAQDERFPAKLLRAQIYMSSKIWDEAAKTLLDLVGPPPVPGQPFREDQADWLLRAAVAMAMRGDQVGLDRLAIDYGSAMAGTAENDAFRLIVEPEKIGESKDIMAAQKRLSEVDMFQGFLNYYRKSDVPDKVIDKKGP